MRVGIRFLSLFIGIFLLIINFAGYFISIDDRIYFDEEVISYNESVSLIEEAYSKYGKSERFLKETVKIVDDATIYNWIHQKTMIKGVQGYVQFYENWILWIARFFDDFLFSVALTKDNDIFSKYEYMHYEAALRRGYGICSQLSVLLADMLTNKYGINTYVVGLSGHVVAQSQINKEDYILDASMSLVMPFGLSFAEKNLESVKSYYKGDLIAETYDARGNSIMSSPGAKGYRPLAYLIEQLAYAFKWIVPIFLLVVGSSLYWKKFGRC
ncbi:conserved hypothetical protein [Candidatus Terasakiella magnetica]|uniref:Transglutaminase-like domain-containing protein n=1 Tax=Candidatus Terasakiella magnetica TaxID=1867952 RepID=A0A1C3RG86_9PROT|nr:transglutaminase-like domain-containing protein [Candidatus Terasakiella magnetica]SCA56269.1 conserved hypothetical protein [Candidatus Terasakiella magnetica]